MGQKAGDTFNFSIPIVVLYVCYKFQAYVENPSLLFYSFLVVTDF